MSTALTVAASSLAASAASAGKETHRVPDFGVKRATDGRKYRGTKRAGRFDPLINRWTGQPHDHDRENARRTIQIERDSDKQAARLESYGQSRGIVVGVPFDAIGMSRRGRWVTA